MRRSLGMWSEVSDKFACSFADFYLLEITTIVGVLTASASSQTVLAFRGLVGGTSCTTSVLRSWQRRTKRSGKFSLAGGRWDAVEGQYYRVPLWLLECFFFQQSKRLCIARVLYSLSAVLRLPNIQSLLNNEHFLMSGHAAGI